MTEARSKRRVLPLIFIVNSYKLGFNSQMTILNNHIIKSGVVYNCTNEKFGNDCLLILLASIT